jgi:uncharacterized protein
MSALTEADFFHWQDDNLVLRLKVQPRASRNAWGEVIGERVKLYLTTPPVDGKANQAVIAFVAKTFSVAKNRVVIRRGETSRDKDVVIQWPQAPKAGSPEAEILLRQSIGGPSAGSSACR